MAELKIVKGNFVWKDGVKDSVVVFEESENGKFKVNFYKPRQFWFRFTKHGYGICFTPKSEALFSIRNGYRKSVFLFGWYIYILKPYK